MRRAASIAAAVGLAFVAGWVARAPDRAVPEVVLRTVRGRDRVVEVAATSRADPPSAACLEQHRLAVALLGLPDDVPLAPPTTDAGCRGRLELADALVTARQLDAIGRPEPFPPDLPDEYREPAFTAVVREVAATCGLDLRRVDCEELPCLALFVRPPGGRSASSCPPWEEAWGMNQTGASGSLVGADGERLTYELVGPAVPRSGGPSPEMAFLADGPDNATKRLGQRHQEARDDLMATFGARELTPDELRDDQRAFWREQADEGNEGAVMMLRMMEEQWAAEDAR